MKSSAVNGSPSEHLIPLPEIQDERSPAVLELEPLRDIRDRLLACVIPEQQTVRTRDGAIAIPAVAGSGEAAMPYAAIAADFMNGLDDQRLLWQSLLDRR